MRKTIRLTEKDLTKIVKRAIQENEKNLDEFFFEKDSEKNEKENMDMFIDEVKKTLKIAKFGGDWSFFSKSEPTMDLDALISRVREICDKYEK